MHHTDPHPAQNRKTGLALAALGLVMCAGAALLGSRLMLDSRPFSEIGGTAAQVAYNGLLLLLLVGLVLLLPAIGRLPGSDGRTLPRWTLGLVGAGAILDACTRFDQAFTVPFLADHAPELLDQSPASMLMTAMVAAWVVYDVGLVVLGVVAFRRRIFSRSAAVLVAVGGALIPLAGPFAVMVVGGGLAWAGASVVRRQLSRVPVPATSPAG
jgi:hypothetical protein